MYWLIFRLHEMKLFIIARIWYGRNLSSRFPTTSGVRQGCIFASALFCVAIDWIIDHTGNKHAGISAGNSQFTNLVMQMTRLYSFNRLLPLPLARPLSAKPRTLGLRISWPKTKIQNVGAGMESLTDITVSTITWWNVWIFLCIWATVSSPQKVNVYQTSRNDQDTYYSCLVCDGILV